ncbi:hypothetical protein RR42_m1387 [Cupriavidus basilensis]|uniref:Uncharacterized protein n=2 Tax=Cupriavidus basilensis TaxID=68895 RepID=A0A0C4Y990_9BURK|nr:hypothetical protein RR42_m1387 [Cupriavidus basilensis]
MVYIQEKAALLDVLRDGNPSLHAVAARIVADALERFGEAEQA